MKETKQSMSLSDVSEQEKQELFEWGKKYNLTEKMMLKLLEQSLEVCNNLDYLHWQMRHFEAWCQVDPKWKEDPVRRAKILRPITNWPSSLGPRPQDITIPKFK